MTRHRLGIRWRRVLHAKSEKFAGLFSFPVNRYPLTRGMKHDNGSLSRTFFNTATTIPAFLRINNNGRFFLFRIRHHDIGGADLDTEVTSGAYIGIELQRLVRCRRIWYHKCFVVHFNLPFSEICDYSNSRAPRKSDVANNFIHFVMVDGIMPFRYDTGIPDVFMTVGHISSLSY